jgi:hypothetical protein
MIIIENSIVVHFQAMKRTLRTMINYNQLDEARKLKAEAFLVKYSDDNLKTRRVA